MMPILACLLSFLLTLGLGQLLCPEAGPVAGAKSVARRPDSAPNAAVANRRFSAVRGAAVPPGLRDTQASAASGLRLFARQTSGPTGRR